MKVVVQQSESAMYLREDEQWTAVRSEAVEFKSVLDALTFCIRCRARHVRLVCQGDAGAHVYLYPFGGDPAVKAELRKLRRSLRESRCLRRERRLVRARIVALLDRGKGKEEAVSI